MLNNSAGFVYPEHLESTCIMNLEAPPIITSDIGALCQKPSLRLYSLELDDQPPFRCPPASTAGIAGTAGTTLLDLSANLLRSFSSWVVVSRRCAVLGRSLFIGVLTTFFTLPSIPACCPPPILQSSARYGAIITTASLTTILLPSQRVGKVRQSPSKIS